MFVLSYAEVTTTGYGTRLNPEKSNSNYHKTVNETLFQNWVVNQLIPALAKLNKKCVVVMDNAT